MNAVNSPDLIDNFMIFFSFLVLNDNTLLFLYFLRCLHLQDYQDHVELEGVDGNVYALENPYEFADGGKGGNCKQKFQNVSRNETQKNVNYGDKIVHTSEYQRTYLTGQSKEWFYPRSKVRTF